jgi:endo-1,4-beta-xylanase
MHGHNLCWNTLNPAWLTQTITSTNAESILTKHISTVVGRYAGKMNSWDVVNEPVATWMGRSDGLYTGPWLNTLGPEYMDIAFHAAAAADPHALRILNTAHNEQGGPGCDASRVATLNLIEALLKRNVPIQAVGLESHLAGNISSGTTLSRSAFMAELRQFGLQILVTEIDVDDTLLPANFAARDALVSQRYSDYLTSIWREAQPSRIIFFTPSDLNNWYDSVNSAPYIRGDGLNHRPGLLDASLAKKSSYQAVATALTQFRN